MGKQSLIRNEAMVQSSFTRLCQPLQYELRGILYYVKLQCIPPSLSIDKVFKKGLVSHIPNE